jgi:hypothetical protein
MDIEQHNAIAHEISYDRTVDATVGIHPSGARIVELKHITVHPSDGGWTPQDSDLTDPAEREWWATWCSAEGDLHRLRAEHTDTELDEIARNAGYDDMADVDDILASTDADGCVSIIHTLMAGEIR